MSHRRWAAGAVSSSLVVAALVVAPGGGAAAPHGLAHKNAVPAQRNGAKAVREEVGSRTATSRTYLLADGSRRTSIWSHAVNVRDASGRFTPIDTTLKAAGDSYRTAAAPTKVTLPGTLDRAVHVEDASGRTVDFSLDDAAAAPAKVAGDHATYAGVRPGVDASYSVASNGVKETLTLADATAPTTYTFSLRASAGLTPSLRKDGSVGFADAHGAMRFRIPAPTVQEHGAASAITAHAKYALSDDGRTLTLKVDGDWLAHADFPVAVDPSLWTSTSNACTIQNGTLADTPDCDDVKMRVGYDGTHVQRALVQFPDVETVGIPTTATISYAQLGLDGQQMSNPAATPRLDAAALSRQFDGGATWNAYDGINSWTTPGGDTGGGAPPITSLAVEPSYIPGGVGWDVTALSQYWVRNQNVNGSNASTNYGVLIKAHDETQNVLLTLGGPEDYDANHDSRPLLNVNWWPRAGSERDQTYEGVGVDDRSGAKVNVVSGNLAVSSNDINIRGVNGLDLNLSRTYNSTDIGEPHLLGSAWTESINGAALAMDYSWLSHSHVLRANGGAVYRYENVDANVDTIGAPNLATPSGIDGKMVESASTNGVTVTWPDGTVWTYGDTLDGYHQVLLQIKDAHNNHIDLHYSNEPDPTTLTSITDSYGNNLTVNRTGGVVSGLTDAQGRHWSYGISGTHNVLGSFTNPDSKATSYTYDATDWDTLTQITDARSKTIKFEYNTTDGDGTQVTKVTRTVDGTTTNDVIWQFNYKPVSGVGHSCSDTTNQRTVETDPRGKKTTYCYNKDGHVVETWDALSRKATQGYNGQGNVTSAASAAGGTGNPLSLSYASDANHNLTGGQAPAGETFGLTYCKNAGSSTNACTGGVASALAENRVQQYTDEQGTKSNFDYNANGDLTSVRANANPTVAGLVLAYNTSGTITDGTLASSTDGNGNVTTYGYTSHNLTSITPPSSSTLIGATTLTYDNENRVKTVTDGLGTVATLAYDGEDRTTSVTYSNGKSFTITYDNNGNPTQRVEKNGTTTVNTTTYGYDNLNRRTSEAFPGSLSNGYGYDKIGNLTSLTDPFGTTTYSYDDINRLTSILSPKLGSANCSTTPASCDAIGYAYTDLAGALATANGGATSRQTVTFPGTSAISQVLQANASGNVTSIADKNHAGTVLQGFSYAYKPSGGNQQSLVSSVTQQPGSLTTTYGYDTANAQTTGSLLSAVTKNSGGTTTDSWSYTYDKAGNRKTRVHGATTTTYAYNVVNELCWAYTGTSANACGTVPAGATTYAFDHAGNQTTGSLGYDALSRLTTAGSSSLTYLTPGQQELTGYGSNTYHNGLLGLDREIVSGATTGYTRQPDGTAVAQRSGTTKQYLLADRLGSITALADDNADSLTRTYTYDPDGNRTSAITGTGSGVITDLGFAGGHLLPNSQYHYGARFYDPSLARWTQQDPLAAVASQQNANRYAYVGGNPVNGTDLAGLIWKPWDPVSTVTKYAERRVSNAGNLVFNTAKRNSREFWKKVAAGGKAAGVVGTAVTVGSCAAKLTGLSDGANDCDPLASALGGEEAK